MLPVDALSLALMYAPMAINGRLWIHDVSQTTFAQHAGSSALLYAGRRGHVEKPCFTVLGMFFFFFFFSFLVLFIFTRGLQKTKFFATIPRVEMLGLRALQLPQSKSEAQLTTSEAHLSWPRGQQMSSPAKRPPARSRENVDPSGEDPSGERLGHGLACCSVLELGRCWPCLSLA